MGRVSGYKPAMAMIGLQCVYTGLALFTRAALLQGMSPRAFVVYRQGIATLIMASIACFTRWRNPNRTSLGLRSFSLIFVTSLIGVTANQNAYFEGLYLSSSTITTAMTNLLPAITFVMATIVGLEKVNVQSLTSIAKIIGTVFSVGGAISMALVKGPKLLNTEFLPSKSLLLGIIGGENLQLGCIFLFISCFCWSFWIIMQVPISASCPDHLYSTLWMCLLTTIQSAIFTFLIEPDLQVWHMHSLLELGSCLYAGIGTAVSFFVQAWCISLRGPVFVAVFSPLCTVITTIMASLFLHEKLYTGSLLGALAVIIGLYIVLWGKAKDLEEIKQDIKDIPKLEYDQRKAIQVLIHQSSKKSTSSTTDLEESLLPDKSSTYANEEGINM
ncbi:Plant-drug/metabolite exporter [Parasponia andersonii]|uniref:WAT1-related protein n=1 Tax=Parasponia andersonii TaxID=3476 RepID=A0A2P5C4U9_PARAD|nr:Plant-drug/metabolite exporter [Parasponia andersonii]